MRLSGQQVKHIHGAILSAYGRNDLRLLTRVYLEQELDTITRDDNLETVVLDLISWAEKNNQLGSLLMGAAEERPNNDTLKKAAADFARWQTAAPSNPTVSSSPRDLFSRAFELESSGQLTRALGLYEEIVNEPSLRPAVLERIASVKAELSARYVDAPGIVNTDRVFQVHGQPKPAPLARRRTYALLLLLVLGLLAIVTVYLLIQSMGGLGVQPTPPPSATPGAQTMPPALIAAPTDVRTPTPTATPAATPTAAPAATPEATPAGTPAAAPDAAPDVTGGSAPAAVSAQEPTEPATGCESGRSIAEPANGQVADRGYITIVGEADLAGASGYTLGYAASTPGSAPQFDNFVVSPAPKARGSLGVWNTQTLPAGDYVLRLQTLGGLSGAADGCTVLVTVSGAALPFSEPGYQFDDSMPQGPAPEAPAGGAAVSISEASVLFSWQADSAAADLFYDVRIFRLAAGGEQLDLVMEWNLPTPVLRVTTDRIINPSPDVRGRMNELGLGVEGEYRWQVRLANFPSPDAHSFGRWGVEGVFSIVAP